MKGKRTNILLGTFNIFIFLLLAVYIWTNTNYTNITRHQRIVLDFSEYAVIVITGISVLLNILFAATNLKKGNDFIYYTLSILSIMVFWHMSYIYIIPVLISGIIIIVKKVKTNYIEREAFWIGTIIIILITLTTITGAIMLNHKSIAKMVKDRENVNLKQYSKEFFKFIQPLEDKGTYINVKIGDKYRYINNLGQSMLGENEEYDYATPFYTIYSYGKRFEIASVSKGTISTIILKDKREVMSYNSEFHNDDPEEKIKEFKEIVKKEMEQEPVLENIGLGIYNGLEKREIYEETKGSKERRYKYNDKYDLILQISELDGREKYTLVTKTEKNKKLKSLSEMKKQKDIEVIELNAEKIIYDDENIYVYRTGELPFISKAEKVQGWFDEKGKRFKIGKKVQIISVERERVAIKVHGKNVAYFISKNKENTEPISQIYKEIIPDKDNYIVKDMSDKWQVLNRNLTPLNTAKFDIFNATLMKDGIYAFANMGGNLEIREDGYPKILYTLLQAESLQVIGEKIENIYDFNVKFKEKNNFVEEYPKFIEKLKESKYVNILDQYYTEEEN